MLPDPQLLIFHSSSHKSSLFSKISDDVITCDLRFGLPNPKSWLRLCIKPCVMCIPDTCCCIMVLLHAPFRVVVYNITKVQNIRCIASSLKILWCNSMEWNVQENFSMEWKILVYIEWKKIARMEYEKIIFHFIPCPGVWVIICFIF